MMHVVTPDKAIETKGEYESICMMHVVTLWTSGFH
jgi:hypothetical protein